MEISSDKSKIPMVSSQIDPPNGRMEKLLEVDQFIITWLPHKPQMAKGSKDQTGAGTLSHDKASSTREKQSDQF